jgi:hypothetical protein
VHFVASPVYALWLYLDYLLEKSYETNKFAVWAKCRFRCAAAAGCTCGTAVLKDSTKCYRNEGTCNSILIQRETCVEWQQGTTIRLWNKNHFPRKVHKVPIISVLSTESGRRHRSPQNSAIVLSTLKSTAVKETLRTRKVIHPRPVVFKCYINSLAQQIQKFSRFQFFLRVLTTSKWRLYNCVSKCLLWCIII